MADKITLEEQIEFMQEIVRSYRFNPKASTAVAILSTLEMVRDEQQTKVVK